MTQLIIPDGLAAAFVLLFTRCGSFLVALPAMLGIAIPVTVRVLLAGVLACAMLPLARTRLPALNYFGLGMAFAVLREAAVGFMLAFSTAAVIGAVGMAGETVGAEMELSAAAILRSSASSETLLGDAFMTLAAFLFFACGFQRALILDLGRSLRVIPLGSLTLPGMDGLLKIGAQIFTLGVSLSLPLLIPLLVLAMAQGVLARFVPQVNLLIAAPAAILLAGLALLALDISGLAWAINQAWSGMLSGVLWLPHG
ncbi:MAG: flagellar biosynthetic protein FliR [Candidatus Binataceae bacterium]